MFELPTLICIRVYPKGWTPWFEGNVILFNNCHALLTSAPLTTIAIGSRLPEDLESNPSIHFHYMTELPRVSESLPRVLYYLFAPIKAVILAFQLFYVAMFSVAAPEVYLVQVCYCFLFVLLELFVVVRSSIRLPCFVSVKRAKSFLFPCIIQHFEKNTNLVGNCAECNVAYACFSMPPRDFTYCPSLTRKK